MHSHPVDPIRFPKVQKRLEDEFKKNFDSTLKVITVGITKILKNGNNSKVE